MKSSGLFLALLFSVSSLLAQSPQSFTWDFRKAYLAGSGVEVPEAATGPAISFRDGAALAPDSDEQGRQVLVLRGAQTDWGRSKRNVEPFNSVSLRARFKPADTGAPLQTIVTAGGCYELRYNFSRERLEFIVNLPDKKYRMVFAEAKPGMWHQAVGTFKDGRLVLTIGLARVEDVLPPELRPASISTTVRVGLVGDRPFSGSISEIAVSTL